MSDNRFMQLQDICNISLHQAPFDHDFCALWYTDECRYQLQSKDPRINCVITRTTNNSVSITSVTKIYGRRVWLDMNPKINCDYLMYLLKSKQQEIGTIMVPCYHFDIFSTYIGGVIFSVPPLNKQNIHELRRIYQACKRYQKLLICEKIQQQCDEFRFRPTGSGYAELKKQNKGKWEDLKD